ncbi:zinc-ribbon domain-containing protein [uncultured Desulfosarcina sp.]|uniref:zinc-ribbon domain-containing protein n=1 Tax=uncultured Desulfosarcina sp. TaxID=218289 RepID=UPI0029C65079|nr:zinc-ribbon domain-containing protein [uncultured Desulfosarcina sp.]
MIITCEACNTSFNLDGKMLKATGSKVRCSVCSKVFTAFPQQAPTPEPPAEYVEPDASPETQAGLEPGLGAASAMASAGIDTPAAADTVDSHTPETDVLDEETGALFAEGADLDFALDDETEDGESVTEIEDAVSGALDDDLADISFESDSEPDLALESDIADESGATIIASLDDDDLDMDFSPDHTDEDGAATVIADLDDDLNLSLDGLPEVEETVIADLDKDDLDLDLLTETDGDSEGTATVIANLDDDSLDLDSDFSLELDEAAKSAASADDGMPETLDDLDDLNLTLDMEPDVHAPQADAVAPKSGEPPLDELSLDFDLETDADMAKASSAAQTDIADVDDDLDLTLDLDDVGTGEMEPAEESPALEDDLDLSSLEGLLKDDEASKADSVTMVVDEGEEQELALDMDEDAPMGAADATDAPGAETLEDLEFNLDGDGKVETLDIDDGDQEIDLSEIEKMLEEPEPKDAKFSSMPEQDLDLDIEASLETEKWMSESGDDDQVVMDDDLDLSDLEQVIDDVDTDAVDDTLEDQELDLDLGEGEALGKPTETVAIDNDLDFDLSDFEDSGPPESAGDTAHRLRESLDMDLEFEVEEGSKAEQTLEDEGLEETVALPVPPSAEKARAVKPQPAETAAPASRPKPAKKGMSKSLVFLLILAILGGGGYGTYYLLNQNGIDIPFLSDYLKPKVQDPGNLKLTTYDINSKFIDNASVGKLFVVSGKVKNGYAENRGMITLEGKIFSTGKVPVNTEKVYCGNVMSDLELANLEWDKIKERLVNRLGDNRSNVKIEPGQSIPFMVVFSGLPEDLEEFTIEVTGSTSLK